MGRPKIDGTDVKAKIPDALLREVDEVWPKTAALSRSDFFREALREKVDRTKCKVVPT